MHANDNAGFDTAGLNFDRNDLLFIVLILLFLSLFGYLLYRDMHYSMGWQNQVPVATLGYGQNRVERKIGGQVLWVPLAKQSDIYNFDSVRTDTGAEAHIELDSGAELALGGNTLVTIRVDDKGKTAFQLEGGDLSLFQSGDQAPLEIESSQGIIKMQEGSANISLNAESGELEVEVLSGSAQFEGKDTQVTEIGEQQGLTVAADGASVEVNDLEFIPISPAPKALLLAFEEQSEVLLRWRSNFVVTHLELAQDVGFSKNLKRITLPKESGKMKGSYQTQLTPGVWFWRLVKSNVESDGEDGEQKTRSSRFILLQDNLPEVISPQDGSELRFVANTPLVGLQWNKSQHAGYYNILVYKNDSLVKTLTVQGNSISLQNLEPGNYHWEAEAIFDAFNQRGKSESSSFALQKIQKSKLPAPVIAEKNTTLSQDIISKGKAVISWQIVPGVSTYRAEVSKKGQEDEVLYEKVVEGNYLILPKDLSAGEYQVRVTALNQKEELSSETQQFRVQKFAPLKLLEPEAEHTTAEPLELHWQDSNNGGLYLLEISYKESFSSTLLARHLDSDYFRASISKPGNYYARVSLLDEQSGHVLLISNVQNFSLLAAEVSGNLNSIDPLVPVLISDADESAPELADEEVVEPADTVGESVEPAENVESVEIGEPVEPEPPLAESEPEQVEDAIVEESLPPPPDTIEQLEEVKPLLKAEQQPQENVEQEPAKPQKSKVETIHRKKIKLYADLFVNKPIFSLETVNILLNLQYQLGLANVFVNGLAIGIYGDIGYALDTDEYFYSGSPMEVPLSFNNALQISYYIPLGKHLLLSMRLQPIGLMYGVNSFIEAKVFADAGGPINLDPEPAPVPSWGASLALQLYWPPRIVTLGVGLNVRGTYYGPLGNFSLLDFSLGVGAGFWF